MSRKALAAALALALAGPIHAATVTLDGAGFDVIYDDALLGWFGQPTLSGDVLFFTPTTFKAQSLNGVGDATEDETIRLGIRLDDGYRIDGVRLEERGDYRMRGNASEVGVFGQLRLFDVAEPFVEVNANIVAATAFNQRNGVNYNWTAGSLLDLSGDAWADAALLNLTVENLLEAYTDAADAGRRLAFIEKKFAGLEISVSPLAVSPVPEPQEYALLLAGLGLVGVVVRRRRA